MSFKKIVLVSAISLALIVPFSVYAATSDSPAAKSVRTFFGIDMSKLDDKQKATIDQYTQKMADLQKEFINEMVANGALTQEKADAEIKRIDEMQKNGIMPGLGIGRGKPEGKGGYMMFGADLAKLTDDQKASLKETYVKMVDLHKDYINKMVSNGLLTQDQGAAAIKKADAMLSAVDKNNLPKGLGMMAGGFNLFMVRGIDTSKLTDQQKADMADFSGKMLELQKEALSKLVSFGVMTADEQTAVMQKLELMQKYQNEKGLKGGMGMMRKGRPGMFNRQGSDNKVQQ